MRNTRCHRKKLSEFGTL